MNTKGEVCEDFAGFIQLERMDAQTIANRLLSTVEGWGLNMSGLIAQGYDGASVMSGSRNGVQANVREKYPNVTYVHCRSHVLNLAVSSGCNKVPYLIVFRSLPGFLEVVPNEKQFLSKWLLHVGMTRKHCLIC